MLKQTSSPYTGQLLALCTSEDPSNALAALECDTNYSPPIAVFVSDTNSA